MIIYIFSLWSQWCTSLSCHCIPLSCHCVPLSYHCHTIVHHCTPLYTTVHHCTPLYANVSRDKKLYNHSWKQWRTSLYTTVINLFHFGNHGVPLSYHCDQSKNHIPSLVLLVY